MSSAPRSPSGPLGSGFTDHQADDYFDVDTVLRSLAHERRREILGLLDGEPVWTRAELAECLYRVRDNAEATSPEEIEIVLVHTHLPILEQADLVALDGTPEQVTQGACYDIVREMVGHAASVTKE